MRWYQKQLFGAAVMSIGLLSALAQPAVSAPSTKATFRMAIKDGYAEMWADARVQSEINKKLRRPLDSRIKIKLRRVQQFNPECARLALVFAEPVGKDLFELQMNLCADGSPPIEGVNLASPFPPANATAVPRLARP